MSGKLYLVPNTLDFGMVGGDKPLSDIEQVLPLGTIEVAARLVDWVTENADAQRTATIKADAKINKDSVAKPGAVQLLWKLKPVVSHLKVFGCVCYMFVPDHLSLLMRFGSPA